MATFKSFEDIRAWQESRKLVRAVCKICKRENTKKDFNFVDQISSAARSVSANIAEGFESTTTAEFIQFLGYAKRSAGEVCSHLHDALDDNYISKNEFGELADQTKKIGSTIAKLIYYLQTVGNVKRTSKDHCLKKRATDNKQPVND